MHLPRGTFHSIKKKVSLKLVLTEVLQSRFSGILTISGGCGMVLLVLRQGQIILAEYNTLRGSQAFDKLSQIDDLQVDAELSTLSDVQMGLAIDYNRAYTVTSAPGTVVFFAKKSHSTPTLEGRKMCTGTIDSSISGFHMKNPQDPSSLPAFDDPNALFDGDLNVLDTMDLEKMAGKIRVNAKHIAKNLDLDHMVDDENKDMRR